MDYKALADKYAMQYGVDPVLYRNLVNQESRWDPNAVSPVGATGLTQAMPATAAEPGFGVTPLDDPTDPEQSLRFGAEYFSKMLQRYGGDVDRALVAYNWGAGNADKWSGDPTDLPAETRDYVQKIKGNATYNAPGNAIASVLPRNQEQPQEQQQNQLSRLVDTRQDPRAFTNQIRAVAPTLTYQQFIG